MSLSVVIHQHFLAAFGRFSLPLSREIEKKAEFSARKHATRA